MIDTKNTLRQWYLAVLRFGSGPLLGWLCLAGALLVVGVYGTAKGKPDWYLKIFGLCIAAIALNACTWLAAMLVGETRQLRIAWLSYVALWIGLAASIGIWPSWGRDMGIVMALSMYSLGFPAIWVLWLLPDGPLPHLPWGLQQAEAVIDPLIAFGLGYLQAFVVLPLLFRWRGRAVARELETEARSDGGPQQP